MSDNASEARSFRVQRCRSVDPRWLACRVRLWPDAPSDGADVEQLFARGKQLSAFLAVDGEHTLGFAEATVRTDYVNGCATSPVAFLEGIWVAPEYRRRGIGRALIAAVEGWAREVGCAELGSDALADNFVSHAVHRAVGFEETEHVVYFRKRT